MADIPLLYSTRFFIMNPGGAYNPAPLHEFDLDDMPHPPTFAPGDVVSHWSRLSNEAEGRTYYYKVLERVFRFEASQVFVFVLVEEVTPGWTEKID